jgi:hypothetical protein
MTNEELHVMKALCDCPNGEGLPSEKVNVYALSRLLREGYVVMDKRGPRFTTVFATEAGRKAYADQLRQEVT